MDTGLDWLIAANAAIWLGIGSYVCLLAIKQAAISKRAKQMENMHHDSQ